MQSKGGLHDSDLSRLSAGLPELSKPCEYNKLPFKFVYIQIEINKFHFQAVSQTCW